MTPMGLGAWCAQAYTTAWTALNLGFRSFLLPEMNSSTLQDALLAIISTSANPWIKETVARCNCEGRIDTYRICDLSASLNFELPL